MAAVTPLVGKPLNQDITDLGTMWEEALIKYNEECKINLRNHDFVGDKSMDKIMVEQEHQMTRFSEVRHDGGKLDKFRSTISKNSDVIKSVATNVASAASSAFPPSAVILTAFNYVMGAAKAVSDDLDMVMSFFDIMKAFLNRISLLEERTPPERQFRQFLMNVFSALLTMCAIATRIQQKGRLRQWARALVDGTDPKLKAAYDTVHMHLERFESAVMIMTLKQTIDSSTKLDGISREINAVSAGVQQSIHLGQQSLEVGQQNYMMGIEISVYAKDSASTGHAILSAQEDARVEVLGSLKKIEKIAQKSSRDRQTHEAPMDAGARRTTAFVRLQDLLLYKLDDQKQIEDLENGYVTGTCQWLQENDVYREFELGDMSLLSLTGPPGIGKSMVSYTAVRRLQIESRSDPTTSVAYFFFREDYAGRRNIRHMLQSCAIQIAARNIPYRQNALATLQRLRDFNRDDYKQLWEHLFRQQFNKSHNRKLVLVLDGIDEMEDSSKEHLREIFVEVSSKQGLQIHVMFSSENDSEIDPDDQLVIKHISMTKETVRDDLRTIAVSRLKTLSRLRKLTTRTKRKVAIQLCKKADTIRYLDHMLRRLNAIGREFAIQNELEQLPSNIREVYKLLLDDCQKARNPKDKAVLKKLFAWLAYSKEPLSLGSAGKLLVFIAKDSEISIDDELEHQCARILRLSNTATDEDQNADSSDDLELGDDDIKTTEDSESMAEDMNVFLGFQERSLRHYFREKNDSDGGLQSSDSVGNMLIFEVIEAVLTFEGSKPTEGQRDVIKYAANHWISHLADIDTSELNDAQSASVIEALCSILSNRNGAIRKMELEQSGPLGGIKEYSVLGTTDEARERALKVLQTWATRAIHLPSTILSPLALTWIKPLVRDSKTVYVKLSDAHVSNWLTAPNIRWNYHAWQSFSYAHNSLLLGKDLQSVKGNEKLREYFNQLDEKSTITEKSILLVSEAFLHIDKTAQSYRAIGMAMEYQGMHEEALKQFRIGLDISVSPSDLIHLYFEMGDVLITLAEDAEKDDSGSKEASVETDNQEGIGSDKDVQNQDTLNSSKGYQLTPSDDQVNSAHKGQDSSNSASNESEASKDARPNSSKKTQKQWAVELSEILSKASNLNIELSEDSEDQVEVRYSLMNVWYMRGVAEVMLDDSTNTLNYMANSIKAKPKGEYLFCWPLVNMLDKRGEHEKVLEIFRLFNKEDRTLVLLWCEDELQKACKILGQVDFLCQAYADAIQKDQWWSDYFRPKFAYFHKTVRGVEGYMEAKDLLQKTIQGSMSWNIPQASFQLSDILVEEFRNTKDPAQKFKIFKEMEKLVTTVRESMGNEFDPTQSQTTIPLALMTRQIKPLRFQEIIQATFEGCLMALRDQIAGNDSVSFRTLAKVLACVPGLQYEARVAASCQLYVVDMETYKKEQRNSTSDGQDSSDDKEPQVNGHSDGDVVASKNESSVDTEENSVLVKPDDANDAKAELKLTEKEKDSNENNENVDEDLDTGAMIQCCECTNSFSDWKSKPVYLCYYCTELALCEKCYNEKLDRENGKLPASWRTLCPAGHKHIKAPVEGWMGVKDGILKIGESEITFRAWLAELEAKKWPAAWERFWSESSV